MLFNKNLFYNLFFIFNLIIFMLISLSLSDLIMIWFFMEMNNFFFMSYMLINLKNKKIIFFYLFIQFISSSILIFLFIFNIFINSSLLNLLILLILMFKLNIPPFHFWMLIMINYLNWNIIFFILTIQKIIPFYMIYLNLNQLNNFMLWLMILISLIIPPFKLLNVLNYKIILLYSSINYYGWLIFLISLKHLIWFMMFLIYSFFILIISFTFNYLKIYFFFKTFNYLNLSIINILLFFTFAGFPPFIFLTIKWFNMYLFLSSFYLNFLFFIFMINSFVMMFIYTRMIYISLYFKSYSNKFFKFYPYMNLMSTSIIITFLLSMSILMI